MMKTLTIYEPAMCCETGLCGVGVDPELLRISTVLSTLKKKQVHVQRYNLNSNPNAFLEPLVSTYLMKQGVEGLPISVVDGHIVKERGYPSNEELLSYLELPVDFLTSPMVGSAFSTTSALKETQSCCCKEKEHE